MTGKKEDIQNTMMVSLLYLCTHSHVVSGLGSQSGGQPVVQEFKVILVQEFKVVLGGLHYECPGEQTNTRPYCPPPLPTKKANSSFSIHSAHVFSTGIHFFR